MLGIKWQWQIIKALFSVALSLVMVLGAVGCSDRASTSSIPGNSGATKIKAAKNLSEVSPPEIIQQLNQKLEKYQPQVSILSPKPDEVLADTSAAVKLQVKDLPIFQNPDLGLGPHVHVILDNQPYEAVYNLSQPLVFKNLSPGTHTIRAFASRPWHESFKNEGAYAQTTFHVLAKTGENQPNPDKPLLAYSRPKGSYGAEPIMLDFYLANAPLHLAAQENAEDEISDWRIRATINGESFLLDRWQPIYLKGFKPGKNLVQLELIDDRGQPISNVFNDTARLIVYEPQGQDTLSQLVRGELSAAAAMGIVDPNYKPAPKPSPSPEPKVSPSVAPTTKAAPSPSPEAAKPLPTSSPSPTPAVKPEVPAPSALPLPAAKKETAPTPTAKPEAIAPSPLPTPEVKSEATAPTPAAPEKTPAPTPAVKSEAPAPLPAVEEETPAPNAAPLRSPAASPENAPAKKGGFFSRFRIPNKLTPSPAASQTPIAVPEETTLPDVAVTPAPKSTPTEEPAADQNSPAAENEDREPVAVP